MSSTRFNATEYKIAAMQNWDIVAADYHRNWASLSKGPFKSTAELVKAARVSAKDSVLDLACGTGAVSAAVMQELGPTGLLVGIDFSFGALGIAKSSLPRGQFFQMDAENVGLRVQFDKILCQYGLMFLPNSRQVLTSLKGLMKPEGRLALTVHGTPEGVPYFSTIMEPIVKSIPDIRPPDAPTVHRYGRMEDLESELVSAGYSEISIKKFTFYYSAGSFEQYWSDYLATTANAIRKRIESNLEVLAAIRTEAEERARAFSNGGLITFPWDVLLATAEN